VLAHVMARADTDKFKQIEWYLSKIFDLNGDGDLEKIEIQKVLFHICEHINNTEVKMGKKKKEKEKLEDLASYYTEMVFKICFGDDDFQYHDVVPINVLIVKCKRNRKLCDILTPMFQ